MSPSEEQLRAALRDGEGDGLDVDTVIRRAHAQRASMREHRVRLASAAAIAAVVAGVGVTAGIVLSNGNKTHASNSAGSAEPAKADTSQMYRVGRGAGTSAGACPTTQPPLATPRSGSSALFAEPVSSILVCAYPDTNLAIASNPMPLLQSTSVAGADAATLANSLERASTAPSVGPCPLFKTANGRVLVFVAEDANGTELPPVEATVLQNMCGVVDVTNGKAVRYDWTPPPVLNGFIAMLQQSPAAAPSPSGS